MDPITAEIEKAAENLEKSSKTTVFTVDLIKSTVREIGPAGLKKAVSTLTDDQRKLLKSVLDEMAAEALAKSKAVESADSTAESEKKKPKQLEADEKVAAEAEAKHMEAHSQQGDRPDGLPEPIVKGGSGSGRKPVNPALSGLESVKEMADRNKDADAVAANFAEAPKPAGEKADEKKAAKKEEKKMPSKALVKSTIEKMQAQNLEKAACVERLAKSLNVDPDKVEAVWDAITLAKGDLSKGDTLAEKGNPEGSQSDVPEHMKDKKHGKKKTPESGESDTTAPAAGVAPLAKAGSFYFEEDPVYFAKSENNPFAVRSTGQNANYRVDEYIDLEAASVKQRLSKSTFDYADHEWFLAKGEQDPVEQVVEANAKKKANAEKEDAEEIRNIKTNEKLARIEGQGRAMPMLKSSPVNELIAKGLDMDQTVLDSAQANRTAASNGAFFVKSFDDSDMDAAFNTQDMWDEAPGKSEALVKASGEGSRGGKVIGHTKSGKPIYDTAKHKAHATFSTEDHQDAFHAHGQEMNEAIADKEAAYKEGNFEKLKSSEEKMKHHSSQQLRHANAAVRAGK